VIRKIEKTQLLHGSPFQAMESSNSPLVEVNGGVQLIPASIAANNRVRKSIEKG